MICIVYIYILVEVGNILSFYLLFYLFFKSILLVSLSKKVLK